MGEGGEAEAGIKMARAYVARDRNMAHQLFEQSPDQAVSEEALAQMSKANELVSLQQQELDRLTELSSSLKKVEEDIKKIFARSRRD